MTAPVANRYQVLGALGEGAMGRVCRALDLATGREVAMKVLALSATGPARQAALLRFKQEFRLMTRVRHPHCCAVHEFGVLPDGRPYFTMELVEGHGLDELLPLSAARVREILAQLALALDAVHSLGLVHRDLKAANVRVTAEGVVKLMDFGLMEVAGHAGGAISGTLAYLAPEVVKRGPVDRRADLYALGALGYELLTGQPPFTGARPIDLLRAHVNERPVPPSLLVPGLDKVLELVVLTLLAKDPLDRFQGAFQVLDALGHPIPVGYGGTLLSSPLVGREAEQAALAERIGCLARREPGGALVLHGPSGMGKSRVLEDLRFMAQLENLPLADAASYEHDATPYGPVAEVLRALWPALLELAPREAARHAPALARLLPELGAEPAPELDPAGEKLRLQAAVSGLIGAIAAVRGLVVVLDDWHWTEPLTRELLEQVMRASTEAPVLFVLASRYPPEGALEWVSTVHALPLAPLDAEGVRRMVGSMLGATDVDPAFVDRVAELTEGVPFVVEGLLEHLVASGALAMANGRWNTDLAIGAGLVPRRLQALIVGRLADLPAGAQRVARVLAVYGREADLAFLQQAAGLPDEDLFAALETLERRQLFARPAGRTEGEASAGGAPARYRFTQDHYHEFLYANLGGDELTALHHDVGRALEVSLGGRGWAGSGQGAPLELLAALAHHFQRGGDLDRTVRYALDAGVGHLELQALAPANRLLKAGLAALSAAGGERPRERLAYLYHLARARRALGATHAAREALAEALTIAEALGEAGMRAELLASLAHVHRLLANWDEAIATGRAALAAYEARADRAGAAAVLLTLSRTHVFRGEQAAAMALGEAALVHARATGDARLRCEALAHLGNLLLTHDAARAPAGLAYLQEALMLLPVLGDKGGLRNAYLLLGNAHQALGEYAAAKDAFGCALALSEEIGAEGGAIAALANLALAALATGEFGEAVRHAQAAYNRALRVQNTYVLGVSMLIEAIAAAHLGRPAEALPLLRRALDVGRDLKHRYLEVLALQGVLEVALLLGDLAGAREAAETLAPLVGGEGEPALRLLAARAEIASRAEDAPGAAAFLALADAEGVVAPAGRLRLLRARARVALVAEDWDGLEGASEEGLALAELLGACHVAAELRGLLGEHALATGSGRAEPHFRAMLVAAEAMGVHLLRAQALFGLAAARPYLPEAADHAARAREVLEAFAAALAPDARERFFRYDERARIREGNHIAFSLPRMVTRGTGPLLGITPDGL